MEQPPLKPKTIPFKKHPIGKWDPHHDFVPLDLTKMITVEERKEGKKRKIKKEVIWLHHLDDYSLIVLRVSHQGVERSIPAWKVGKSFGGRKWDFLTMQPLAWKLSRDFQ